MTTANVTYNQLKAIRAGSIALAQTPVCLYEDTPDTGNGAAHFVALIVVTNLNVVFAYEIYSDVVGVSLKPASFTGDATKDFPGAIQCLNLVP